MRKKLDRKRLRDHLIPISWNRWYQIGVAIMVVGYGLRSHTVALLRWIGFNADPSHAGRLAAAGVPVAVFGFFVAGLTGFGAETVRFYRSTRHPIEKNRDAALVGRGTQRHTWESTRYMRLAYTYCAQIGVKAAASEYGFGDQLPKGYATWTDIKLRCLPWLAWVLLSLCCVGCLVLFLSTSRGGEAFGFILMFVSMVLIAKARDLELWE